MVTLAVCNLSLKAPTEAEYKRLGFCPVFELPADNGIEGWIDDGTRVIVGTLYMGDQPIRAKDPSGVHMTECSGKLKLRSALSDESYHLEAIKAGNRFVCDHCVIRGLSYDKLAAAI